MEWRGPERETSRLFPDPTKPLAWRRSGYSVRRTWTRGATNHWPESRRRGGRRGRCLTGELPWKRSDEPWFRVVLTVHLRDFSWNSTVFRINTRPRGEPATHKENRRKRDSRSLPTRWTLLESHDRMYPRELQRVLPSENKGKSRGDMISHRCGRREHRLSHGRAEGDYQWASDADRSCL